MDTALGLLELAFYVVCILSLSAGVTFLVVKISPAGGRKPKPEQPS
jgi:hypothetical protein